MVFFKYSCTIWLFILLSVNVSERVVCIHILRANSCSHIVAVLRFVLYSIWLLFTRRYPMRWRVSVVPFTFRLIIFTPSTCWRCSFRPRNSTWKHWIWCLPHSPNIRITLSTCIKCYFVPWSKCGGEVYDTFWIKEMSNTTQPYHNIKRCYSIIMLWLWSVIIQND